MPPRATARPPPCHDRRSVCCRPRSAACSPNCQAARLSTARLTRSIERLRGAVRRRPRSSVCAAQSRALATRASRRAQRVPESLTRRSCRCRRGATTSRAAISRIRSIIVCGETGSGKTTQLPKICLERGRGVARPDRHTRSRGASPRAASPTRIAQELGTPLGDVVGYKVRFTDRRRPDALHQADDRRHPARRDAVRPRCSPHTTRSSSTKRTSAASTSIFCWAT